MTQNALFWSTIAALGRWDSLQSLFSLETPRQGCGFEDDSELSIHQLASLLVSLSEYRVK
jgi:hypothetical protein